MIMDLTEASYNQCTIVVRYIFAFFIRCYVQTPEKSLVVSRRAETFSVKFYRICRTYMPTSLLVAGKGVQLICDHMHVIFNRR